MRFATDDRVTGEIRLTKLDLREVALAACAKALEDEGHAVVAAMSNGLGVLYVDGVGPMFIVEIHDR